MRWSFGFGPFRIYGGKSAAARRAGARNRAKARQERQRQRGEQQRRETFDREYYSPEAVAGRAAEKADHDRRTFRAVVSARAIDPLAGGKFTITAPGKPDLPLIVPPRVAMRFLPLRRGDVVEVTLTADGGRIEEFLHIARANGAEPRNGADFGKRETARLAPADWLQIGGEISAWADPAGHGTEPRDRHDGGPLPWPGQ